MARRTHSFSFIVAITVKICSWGRSQSNQPLVKAVHSRMRHRPFLVATFLSFKVSQVPFTVYSSAISILLEDVSYCNFSSRKRHGFWSNKVIFITSSISIPNAVSVVVSTYSYTNGLQQNIYKYLASYKHGFNSNFAGVCHSFIVITSEYSASCWRANRSSTIVACKMDCVRSCSHCI